jgi:invasion protein IalB
MRAQSRNEEEVQMRNLVFVSAAVLLMSSVASAPALAQTAQASQTAKPAHDPNEVVCEKQEDTGSRVASHKICKTRAEWAEERRENRQNIDKIQMQRGCADSGC